MHPNTLAEAVEEIRGRLLAQDVVLAEFVDAFDLAETDQDRYASIEREPKLTGDAQAGRARRCHRRIFGEAASAGPRSRLGF